MKRVLVLLVATMMVVGMAGQAMADFSLGSLQLALYGGDAEDVVTGNEIIVDLSSLSLGADSTITTDIKATDLDVTSWSEVSVGIYGGTYEEQSSFIGTNTVLVNALIGSVTDNFDLVSSSAGFDNALIALNYTLDGETGPITNSKADALYLDEMGTSGIYTGIVASSDGDHGLEGTLSADDVLMMTLYDYDTETLNITVVDTIFLYANAAGNLVVSTVDASAVPVPGAFILLGSALMGIVGVRRKNA